MPNRFENEFCEVEMDNAFPPTHYTMASWTSWRHCVIAEIGLEEVLFLANLVS